VDETNFTGKKNSNAHKPIGIDALPENIRNSNILSAINLAQLANIREYPVIDPSFDDDHLKQIIQYYSLSPDEMEKELQLYAKRLLEKDEVYKAWQVLLAAY